MRRLLRRGSALVLVFLGAVGFASRVAAESQWFDDVPIKADYAACHTESALAAWAACCPDQCCCGCCCVDPCARWTITAGALFLERSDPDSAVLFSNALDPSENFNADQFDLGVRGGFELGVIKHDVLRNYICDLDLEARFFSIDGWTDTATFSTTPVLSTPPGTVTQVHTNPVASLDGPRDISSTYTSELTSFELNLRRRSVHCPRVLWMAGFRAFELDENLNSYLADPNGVSPTAIHRVSTRNRLYGFQAGGELDLLNRCCWCLRGYAKGGIYGNASNNTSLIACCADLQPTRNASESDCRTAFAGETGLSLKYCWCPNLAIRADYRLMWLSGVALASEQFAATNFATGTGVDTSGDVFYHGAYVGLEYTF